MSSTDALEAMRERMNQLDRIIDEEVDEVKHAHIYEKINQVNERIDRLESRVGELELLFDRLNEGRGKPC